MQARHGSGIDGNETPAAITNNDETFPQGQKHKLLLPDVDPEVAAENRPLIICFHGSGQGESCSPSWDALARLLTAPPLYLRVLLFDRGDANPTPTKTWAEELRAYLRTEGIGGPYVLVAHSYGGAFARIFVEVVDGGNKGKKGNNGSGKEEIVGVVLVETGQEGGLDVKVEEGQYERRILGMRPLSVVRGNFLIGQWVALEKAEAAAEGNGQKMEELRQRREMLMVWDRADEEMKKKQLELAAKRGRKKFVQVTDCGHHVVRDRPDVVAEEVAWVVENMGKLEDMEGDEGNDGEGEENEGPKGKEGGDRRWGKAIKRPWRALKEFAYRLSITRTRRS